MIHVAFAVDFFLDPNLLVLGTLVYLAVGLIFAAYVQFEILNKKFSRPSRMKASGLALALVGWPVLLPLMLKETRGWKDYRR